jgi:hypothetical protein
MSFITENGIKKFNMLCISVLLAILIFASCFAGLYYLYDEFYVKSQVENDFYHAMRTYPKEFKQCENLSVWSRVVHCVKMKISE